MDSAVIVTWSEPIPGREQQALDSAAKSSRYWNARAAEGRCSAPEMFVDANGDGIWIVKGEREALMALFLGPESQRLATGGALLPQDDTCEFARTGAAADAHMPKDGEAVHQLALVENCGPRPPTRGTRAGPQPARAAAGRAKGSRGAAPGSPRRRTISCERRPGLSVAEAACSGAPAAIPPRRCSTARRGRYQARRASARVVATASRRRRSWVTSTSVPR